MRFNILTIFPDFFTGPFDHGVLSRAITTGLVEVATHDLRAFTHDRHRTVDDRPFGGGEGMVLKPQPIFECIEAFGADETTTIAPKSTRDTTRQSVILLSAQGRPFTQATAHRLAKMEQVVLICGRYEGVDERVSDLLADEELSIGDYVLSGGELAAAIIVDATVRLIPGVLGHADSNRYESFGVADHQPEDPDDGKTADGVPRSTHGAGGILDYPHYTRPADFRGTPIPDVLAGGDHAAIRHWRRQMALAKTLRNRPDLLARAPLTREDRAYLATLGYRPTS
ncbi:MAG: tRNA (guanosine(37)-N1)-methyltransferase TrmD [Acidobacteriaceae bacterium]|nr:tRNA (guanosine(37)-N1)-methyltransferase TrmD [Acidobacteriaceae bacterium]